MQESDLTNNSNRKVLVWLSGGVDSAVAAHLLIQQWYEVIAGFMKNYSDPDNPNCTTRQDRDSALKVAEHLGIKTFIIFDFRTEYEERIINYIYEGYKSGITPNPDVFCNNLIKFDLFLEQALKLGCDYVATGHYARKTHKQTETSDRDGHPSPEERLSDEGEGSGVRLQRAIDKTKDQSYFLARLSQYQLDHALFPLGELTKVQVRQIAHDIWLPNADRPDSQWLCFIGTVPMSEFLKRKLPEQTGDILDKQWNKVGTHQGARFYTIGQRHQLFLPFRAYVIATDVQSNTITVSDNKDDTNLRSDNVTVTDRYECSPLKKGVGGICDCLVKIRYRSEPIKANKINNSFTLSESARWIAPGQILVCYDDQERVLGSGIII